MRRAESRRRLRWVPSPAVVLVIVVAVLAVLGSSLFAVDDGRRERQRRTPTPTKLQAVVDDLMGTPVLLVDTEQAEAELEAIPWVENARVTHDFPHTASIEIRERTPLVAMAGAGRSDPRARPATAACLRLDRRANPLRSCGSAAPARSTRRSAVGRVDRLFRRRVAGDEADARPSGHASSR